MKKDYWFFGAVILFYIGRLLYLYYKRNLYKKAGEEIAGSRNQRYLELREEVFALKPEDLGIALPENNETAFALLLEAHLFDVLQTVAIFFDGRVWIFNTNNARKYVSDNNAEPLRSAALEAIAAAQYHFARMRRRDQDVLLPGQIKFYILTNLDIYSTSGIVVTIPNESSAWSELIEKAFAVVDEWNIAADKTPIKRVYTKIAVKRSTPANF